MTHPNLHILLVDDETDILKSVGTYLTDLGHHIHTADGSGFDILAQARKATTEVIMMTAFGDAENTVRALREGAFDFYNKPIKLRELTASLERTIRYQTLKRQNEAYRQRLDRLDRANQKEYGLSALIGQSPAIEEIREKITQVSQTPTTTVLITGETGTGKELVARAVHQHSSRADNPFVAVDCSAITETLFETAFYGHTRGAFTDAREARQGYFELADSGTLFLDEIGDMNPDMQAGLLRTLEERTIRPVGSNKEIPIDIRVVSATNRDLKESVAQNTFRNDLFYRLNTFTIHVPPLRDRHEDIPLLPHHFAQIYSREMHKPIQGLNSETEKALVAHPFPGNIRELRNIIEHAVIVCQETHLSPDNLHLPSMPIMPSEHALDDLNLQNAECKLIAEALFRSKGNQVQAAGFLGITRDALRRRMERYGLS